MKIEYEIIGEHVPQSQGESYLNHGVSVKSLLQIDSLFSEVFMPKQYNTLIKRVSVIEVKEFSSWLLGNELALTTIQNFSTRKLQKNLLHQLAIGGAACLAFHPGLEKNKDLEIFSETISYARKLHFPILLLNDDATYSETIESIFKIGLESQNKSMGVSSQINHELFQYLSNNLNLKKTIQKIGEHIGKGVLVSDANLNPLAHSENTDYSVLKDLLVDKKFQKFINKKDIIKLFTNGNMLHLKIIKKHSDRMDILLSPVNNDHYLKSILFVIGKPNYLLIEKVLKDATTAIQMKMSDTEEINFELMNLASRQLFIHNDLEKARLTFKKLGIKIASKLFLFVMDIMIDTEDVSYRKNLKSRIKRHVKPYLAKGDYSVWFEDKLIILIDEENKDQLDHLVYRVDEIMNYFFPFLTFYIGISSVESANLYYSYKEATHAIKEGEENGKSIMKFDEMGFSQIYTGIKDFYYMNNFCKKALAPLLALEHERQMELLGTMKSFINNNLNYKETADQLRVHPNTVRYRIKQINQIYKDETILFDSEKRFQLQFALKLHDLI